MSDGFSNLLKRGKAPDFILEDPSAPPLFCSGNVDMPSDKICGFPNFQLDVLPPPYQAVEKERKIKNWEVNMNLVYMNENTEQQKSKSFSPLADKSERCPVCFNAVGEEKVVFHKAKVCNLVFCSTVSRGNLSEVIKLSIICLQNIDENVIEV